MTQTFAVFTGAAAPVYFPGAAFLVAGVLASVAMLIFVRAARVFVATTDART
jgi:hypothetical protein